MAERKVVKHVYKFTLFMLQTAANVSCKTMRHMRGSKGVQKGSETAGTCGRGRMEDIILSFGCGVSTAGCVFWLVG